MNKITIKIASDFSEEPSGRYHPKDGKYTGERFRNEFLMPQLKQKNKIIIDFDGAEGYGSSFLEEAFGGLVRCGFDKNFLLSSFIFISNEDPSIIDEVKEYINDEENKK